MRVRMRRTLRCCIHLEPSSLVPCFLCVCRRSAGCFLVLINYERKKKRKNQIVIVSIPPHHTALFTTHPIPSSFPPASFPSLSLFSLYITIPGLFLTFFPSPSAVQVYSLWDYLLLAGYYTFSVLFFSSVACFLVFIGTPASIYDWSVRFE